MESYLCVICEERNTNNLARLCNTCADFMSEKAMKFYDEFDSPSKYTEERLNESDPLDNYIDRVSSIIGSKKALDEYELFIDKMDFFIKNKKQMEDDFREILTDEIGEDKAIYFCNLIRNYWYDGNKRVSSKEIKKLKYSINKYLGTNCFVLENKIEKKIKESCITHKDIGKILKINENLFHRYLEDWIEQHPLSHKKSTSNTFFSRGLNLGFKLSNPYKEKDYINSYSLSYSMVEQFSDMGNNTNVIVSGEYGLFYQRILFFSPFIPKPDKDKKYPEQLEIGVIPHTNKIYFEEKKYLGGVVGYKLYK